MTGEILTPHQMVKRMRRADAARMEMGVLPGERRGGRWCGAGGGAARRPPIPGTSFKALATGSHQKGLTGQVHCRAGLVRAAMGQSSDDFVLALRIFHQFFDIDGYVIHRCALDNIIDHAFLE